MEPEPTPPAAAIDEPAFSRLVENVRPALRGYIRSLTPDATMADEVFQDTLIHLWRDRKAFDPASNFRAWAFRCGYFAALAKKRDRSREKTVCYPDELFHRIADRAERHGELTEARLAALRGCVATLDTADRALLARRYGDESRPISEEASGAGALYKSLSRLRLRLKICIEKRLKDLA